MTVEEFLEKWKTGFIYDDPHYDCDREMADRAEMKEDLEEMLDIACEAGRAMERACTESTEAKED